jgi:glycolate oxidase
MVSSIGGNCSTNAGGPHCLKYGITVNHVLGLQVVTGAGELVWLGSKVQERTGYDLTGVFVGGEGTLGLVTAAIVRLLHVPEGVKTLLASYSTLDDVSETVSAIVAAGIIPSALELIVEFFVRAIEEGIGAGYPERRGRGALIELDGPSERSTPQGRASWTSAATMPARDPRGAERPSGRPPKGRGWAGVVGRLSRLIPAGRGRAAVATPQIMREMQAISARHGLGIANVFHAGDGNSIDDPLDDREPGEVCGRRGQRELPAPVWPWRQRHRGARYRRDKAESMPLQFADADLAFMARSAGFDPDTIMNPGSSCPPIRPAWGYRPGPRASAGAW